MEQMLSLVSNMGFPIVVSIYLLVRVESRIQELARSINELAQAVASLK